MDIELCRWDDTEQVCSRLLVRLIANQRYDSIPTCPLSALCSLEIKHGTLTKWEGSVQLTSTLPLANVLNSL
jgi:hypothetical protein